MLWYQAIRKRSVVEQRLEKLLTLFVFFAGIVVQAIHTFNKRGRLSGVSYLAENHVIDESKIRRN